MSNRKKQLLIPVLLVLLAGIGFICYYFYQQSKVIKPDHFEWMKELDFEEIKLETTDKSRSLYGYFLKYDDATDNTVIIASDSGFDEINTKGYTEIFRKLEYNVLIADTELEDYSPWFDYIVKETGEDAEIVLMGVSGAGVNVLRNTGEETDNHVKAVIADSTLVTDDNIAELSAQMNQSAIPILFIHSKEDEKVSYTHYEQLFQSCTGIRELYKLNYATHGNGCAEEPEIYQKRVTGFVNKYMDDGVNAEATCCDI